MTEQTSAPTLTDAERGHAYEHFDAADIWLGHCYLESDVERIVAARVAEAVERAEVAEAESANLSADYDRRGERLWRLADMAGHVPHESDNDATAELVVAYALTEHAEAVDRERAAWATKIETLADRGYGVRPYELRALLAADGAEAKREAGR